MVRIIVLILAALAIFWCYNNVNFSNVMNNVTTSIKNEKTIKAVNSTHDINYDAEQEVVGNN